MRKLIEERIVELYKKLNLTISIAEFKNELVDYLKERHPELRGASTTYVLWATPIFTSWMENSGGTIETFIEDVTKFIFGSIIILRLPQRVHRTLWYSNIRFLDELKDYVLNPDNLLRDTDLTADMVAEVVKSYKNHFLNHQA